MPYSFTQIEEDKSRTIGLVFSFLIFFYFVTVGLIALIVFNVWQYQNLPYENQYTFGFGFPPAPVLFIVFIVAAGIGTMHWFVTVENLIPKLTGVLAAEALNPRDSYHLMFQNILEEVSVATGGKKIEGLVIPTAAMNAFALQDFNGKNFIGVTEGLLARLNRAQLEAVVGHEAAHIVSGDCLGTTVTTSLFALYGSLLSGIEKILRSRRGYSSRSSGSAVVIILLVYILLLLTRLVSNLVRMFISRERELRADAVAVRLTRDPLSLAEALYNISYRWRGQGLASEELEAIFIVNPQYSTLDESSGAVPDLFSTHPPVTQRLKILLDMAHTDLKILQGDVEKKPQRPKQEVPEASSRNIEPQWMVNNNGAWQGPFGLQQITGFNWLRSETWVKRAGDDKIRMAFEDEDITKFFQKGTEVTDYFSCPHCRSSLAKVFYEGVEVNKCPLCQGTLVKENDIKRIIIREDIAFSERVIRIAESFKDDMGRLRVNKINRDPATLLPCPKCFNVNKIRMNRVFYTEAYQIEVDRCYFCGLYWFEKDELEVLQYLIEQQAGS